MEAKILKEVGPIKESLRALKDKYTVAEMALIMKCNRSTLSRYINDDDYRSAEIEEKASEFIKREFGNPDEPDTTPAYKTSIDDMGFVPTRNALMAIAVLDDCMKYHDDELGLGLILGPAGSGKTRSVKEFAKQHPGQVVHIEVSDNMALRDLIEEIGIELGIGDQVAYGSTHSRVRKIVKCLTRDPKMIVIDEADKLVNDYSVKKIEVLRWIQDRSKAPVVLVGLPTMAPFLYRGPSLKENLSQLYSRLGGTAMLGGLIRKEAETMLDGYPVTDDAREELIKVALDKEHGGVRALVKTLRRSLYLAEGTMITAEIVLEARRLVFPEVVRGRK
jgi:DNA transposition AAA+ family ATPase